MYGRNGSAVVSSGYTVRGQIQLHSSAIPVTGCPVPCDGIHRPHTQNERHTCRQKSHTLTINTGKQTIKQKLKAATLQKCAILLPRKVTHLLGEPEEGVWETCNTHWQTGTVWASGKAPEHARKKQKDRSSVCMCAALRRTTVQVSMRPRPRSALFMVLNLKLFALTMIVHTVWRLGSGCICGCLFLKISFTWKWSHSRCRLVSAHVSKMGRDWFLFFKFGDLAIKIHFPLKKITVFLSCPNT